MSKRHLVTGGSGFIGSSLVRRLLERGDSVRVLDNNSRGNLRRLQGVLDDLEFIEADIRDPQAVAGAAAGVDSIIHLAYVNGTEFFYSQPALVLDIGVRGMLNVLDACLLQRVPELILASSSEVYQTPSQIPTPETVPLVVPDVFNPRYSYGGGKIISELLALNFGRQNFERVCIFRPHNVFGPDMGWEHVIPQFALRLNALHAQQPHGKLDFPIQGSGKETRSFIHIHDFIDGVMVVLNRGEHLNVYHIGTQDERTITQVAETVGAAFGRQVEVHPGQLADGGTLRRCPDISKLMKLGFSPNRNFDDDVSDVSRWYAANAHMAPATNA